MEHQKLWIRLRRINVSGASCKHLVRTIIGTRTGSGIGTPYIGGWLYRILFCNQLQNSLNCRIIFYTFFVLTGNQVCTSLIRYVVLPRFQRCTAFVFLCSGGILWIMYVVFVVLRIIYIYIYIYILYTPGCTYSHIQYTSYTRVLYIFTIFNIPH
jgi:hypothetical protein